jgi:hypothetical protein
LQRGGVGFYPTSGSPFVHLDTGSVRHWPNIAADEMPRLMARGHDLHAAAESAEVAGNRRPPALFAKLVGGRSEQDAARTSASARPEASRPAPVVNVAVQVEKPAPVAVPPSKPRTQPATFEVASAESHPASLRPAQAASLMARTSPSANDLINQRDYWHLVPPADVPDPPQTGRRPAGTAVASAEPEATASLAPWPLPERVDARSEVRALAYADPSASPAPAPLARPAPMGALAVRPPPPPPDTTVAVKRSGGRPTLITSSPGAPAVPANPDASKTGDQFNEPWLRAMIVSPSVQEFMSTSTFGTPDYRGLAGYLRKPPVSVMMTFSDDPQLGMTSHRLSGPAVVFVSTVTFNARTASLR